MEFFDGIHRDDLQLRYKFGAESWGIHVRTAWAVDPRIALALVARFPGESTVRTEVAAMVQVCFFSTSKVHM